MVVLAFLKGCVPVWVRSALSLSLSVPSFGTRSFYPREDCEYLILPSGNQTWHCKMSVNGHLNQKRTDVMCVNEGVSEFPYLPTCTCNIWTLSAHWMDLTSLVENYARSFQSARVSGEFARKILKQSKRVQFGSNQGFQLTSTQGRLASGSCIKSLNPMDPAMPSQEVFGVWFRGSKWIKYLFKKGLGTSAYIANFELLTTASMNVPFKGYGKKPCTGYCGELWWEY